MEMLYVLYCKLDGVNHIQWRKSALVPIWIQIIILYQITGSLDDLKSALRQEAERAYLRLITTVRSLELKPRAELCGDLWMEYINRECTTDASDPSCPTPFSPYEKIEEPFL